MNDKDAFMLKFNTPSPRVPAHLASDLPASGHQCDVSVIIPVFNAEATIGNLAKKILSEKQLKLELIIVNDGSTDATLDILHTLEDDRVIVLNQTNKGVYAARNAALTIHTGEWVIFLDADDHIIDGFVYERWQTAQRECADAIIFNACRTESCLKTGHSVHHKQPYGRLITGHEWIKHCVSQKEWPHYLWLQIIKSSYIRKNNLSFYSGRSHKDILWTVCLAVENGAFYFHNTRDYVYNYNTASITNRNDYFDTRAIDYIEVIAEIICIANKKENQTIKASLLKHALVETRHFLGLYRKKVKNHLQIKTYFIKKISLIQLFKGISNTRDLFFFIKLFIKIAGHSSG